MKNCKRLLVPMITLCLFISGGCQPTDSLTETPPEAPTPLSVVKPTPTESILSSASSNLLLSATPSPVTTATVEAGPTSTTTPSVTTYIDMGRLVFARHEYYGWFDLVAEDSSQGLIFEAADEYHKFTSRELINGPGQGTYHVFSHYSDYVAFWTADGELWISDVTYQRPQQIMIDQNESYVPKDQNLIPWGNINLTWSPDDLHLLIYNLHDPELNLIYHIETGQLEEWQWQCQSLIVSIRSERLATLCSKINGVATEKEMYAILEWGGEIWFSKTLPGELFLEPLPDGTVFWQWSADGEWVAYYDPNNQEGHLLIADAKGNIRKLLPGASPFRESEIEGYQEYQFLQGDSLFYWASNAPLLLVRGFGQPDRPCPPLVSEESDPKLIFEQTCWKVVNINTGEIIWDESNLANSLTLISETDEIISMGIDNIVISPDGRAIAALTSYDMPRIVIVDLQTALTTTISRFDRFRQIYWGR